MDANKKYHIALLVDTEPTLVALSYHPKTRVEKVQDVDVSGGVYRAVDILKNQGFNVEAADRNVADWARLFWRDRTNPNYAEQRYR